MSSLDPLATNVLANGCDLAVIQDPGYWHDVVCKTYVTVRCNAFDDQPFSVNMALHEFGTLRLTEVTSTGIEYRRGAEELRQEPRDDYMLNLILEGHGGLEQSGRSATQGPGDLLLYDMGRPYAQRFAALNHCLTLIFPRALLLARIPEAERLTARTLVGTTPLGRMVGSMLRECANIDNAGAAAPKIVGVLMDLLAGALQTDLLGRELLNGAQQKLLERVKQYLGVHLEDPDLNVAHVSGALGISERTLHRLFAVEGCTMMRWVWQQRLSASYRDLAEGRCKQIMDVALRYGFNDYSHFSRLFKSNFGLSPRELLATSRR